MADEPQRPGPDPSDGDADLAELRRLAERVRPGDVAWEPPPADLWDRIESELAEAVPPPAPAPAPRPSDAPVPVGVLDVGARRRSRWVAVALAAAAALILVVVAAALVVARDDGGDVVAETALERLGPTGSGTAELLEHDGRYQLRVETADLDDDDGYLELWLIDPSVTKMVSLGPLRPDGLYDLPAGVDPTTFPIVDVSAEPVDGDPAHSGNSLLRGQLPL